MVMNFPIHVGVDATALKEQRTGVGNYIYPLLLNLCESHPHVKFTLYSNDEIVFPCLPNVRKVVSKPKRRGPFWQSTHLREMLCSDLPHIYWGSNGFLPFPSISGLRTVVTIYDLTYMFAGATMPLQSRLGRWLLQPWSAKTADRVISISRATAADISTHYQRFPNAIIEPCVSPCFQCPGVAERIRIREKYNLPKNYFLILGTLEPRKNISTLLDAYRVVRETYADLPPLLLVGGGGWKNRDLIDSIKLGESQGFVRRMGYLADADLPALYAECDAFLMPSLYEGYGMPVLEAQLCGAPVVHGNHPSMVEASAGLGLSVDSTKVHWVEALTQFAQKQLPLVCRWPLKASQNVPDSAGILWREIQLTLSGV